MTGDHRPVPRPRVAVGALIGLVLVVAMVAGVEALRHPFPSGAPSDVGLAEDDSDPRLPIECNAGEPPREGQRRAETPQEQGGALLDRPVEITSSQLYDCPQRYDGVSVRYTGEVVGAVLERPGGAWVQLNDDVYAGDIGPLPTHRDFRGGNAGIGVFVPPSVVEQIDVVGGPDARGDVVEVEGIFRRVDEPTAEVTIIRADVGRVVRDGGRIERTDLPDRRVVGVIVALVAIGASVAERVVVRRR